MSKDPMRDLSGASGIGFTLVAYVLVFTAVGYGLDRLARDGPLAHGGGCVRGAVLGFIYLIRTLTRTADRGAQQQAARRQTETRRASTWPGREAEAEYRSGIRGCGGGLWRCCIHLFSVRYHGLACRAKGRQTFPAAVRGGFLLRLRARGIVFVALALWLMPHLNLVASALALHRVLSPALAGFSLYRSR